MTIGNRILTARLEAGLSQRQLAGENMTRNMLSALEHDKAKPSLDTLMYLSAVLNRPVGYFLGEDIPVAPGYDRLERARERYDMGFFRECVEELEQVPPDGVLDRERRLLRTLAVMALARQAMEQGKMPYARRMLEESVEDECPYFTEGLRRELAILRKRAGLPADIPGDGALILRGEEAIARGRFQDALRYLQAEDIRGSSWDYLMGEALFGLGRYAEAVEYYTSAEEEMPRVVRRRLQLCYAELKDFEKAYRYATMGMDMD